MSGRQRVTLRFLGMAALLCAGLAGMAGAAIWATIDARLLMVLHPTMATFDFSQGRFYRPGLQNLTPGDLQKQLEQARKKVEPQLKSLGSRRARLVRSRNDMLASREETINLMLAHGASATSSVRDHGKNLLSFEERYQNKLRQFEEELEAIDREYTTVAEQAWAPVYMTAVETDRLLQTVRGEIAALAADAAQRLGCSLVIDPNAANDAVEGGPGLGRKVSQSEPVDLLGSKLFKLFGEWEVPEGVTIPGPTGEPVDLAKHLMPVLMGNMAQNFRQYLEFRPYLPSGAGQLDAKKLTLDGEPDLTEVVAREVFRRHRVPTERQESLMVLIRSFCTRKEPGEGR